MRSPGRPRIQRSTGAAHGQTCRRRRRVAREYCVGMRASGMRDARHVHSGTLSSFVPSRERRETLLSRGMKECPSPRNPLTEESPHRGISTLQEEAPPPIIRTVYRPDDFSGFILVEMVGPRRISIPQPPIHPRHTLHKDSLSSRIAQCRVSHNTSYTLVRWLLALGRGLESSVIRPTDCTIAPFSLSLSLSLSLGLKRP
jgi:hypothetical protein